ncbi:MAG: efflux RND transporter periplasmic adaptor subunit [Gammaproteobacteria bacterium]|nr:efflux RND transporter periplasmic adaptor subunit [Gammaproteobacteria bacterium]
MTGSGNKGTGNSQATNLTGKARAARLCYVDDSRTSAYVVKRMLKPYGYIVDHYESAEPALIALIESEYDLLLTDLKVSPTGMDGDDLVRALRSSGHKKIASMPIIVITGATDTEILSQVYQAGANKIMTKPVNGEELDAHIRKLVFTSRSKSAEDEFADLAAEAASLEHAAVGKGRATVVPFGSDVKKSGAGDAPSFNAKVETADDAARRVLSQEAASSAPPLTTPDGRPIPRPAAQVKPAPRVKPTIRPPSSISISSTASIASAGLASGAGVIPATGVSKKVPLPKSAQAKQADTVRREQELDELKKKAAARLAQQTMNRTAVKATMASRPSQAGVGKPVDPEVLKKIKAAAAAKKAKFIEQQRARQGQAPGRNAPQTGSQSKVKSMQEKLQPEIPLTLEPKENEPVDIFNKSQGAAAGINGFQSHAGVQHTQSKPEPARSKPEIPPAREPLNDPFSNQPQADPFAEAAKSAAQNFRSSRSSHTADLFGQRDNANILRQMEQFPLVQSDFRDSVGSSGVFNVVNSIVELWGPKKVILAVAIVAVLAFFYNSWSGIFSEGVSVEATVVEQGEIFQSITVPGKVVSKLRVDITPSIAGRLTNVYVEEGDEVKKDELLARLDDREAKSNLKLAEANLHNAEEDVSLAERSLTRLRQAFSKGAVARQLVEEAEVELRSAKARLSVAEEEVRTAKVSLENPRIIAPFAGAVTARHVEMGQWVVPSETLFTLVDQSQREIEVRVDAADSGGIAVGQTVTLTSDAFPGLEWPESVTRLAAATSNVGNANTVSVYISLGNSAPSLRYGQQVDAEIRTAWNPSALKVPYGAIISRDGKTYVAVVQDNFVDLVEVETGIEDFTHVEIRQGVSVGQHIILANGADIEEGDRVVIASNN